MTVPNTAKLWLLERQERLTNIDLKKAADRLAYEEFADEYYKKFQRELWRDEAEVFYANA